MQYLDRVQHRSTGNIGTVQGESVEHTNWVVVRWDNSHNLDSCFPLSELLLLSDTISLQEFYWLQLQFASSADEIMYWRNELRSQGL